MDMKGFEIQDRVCAYQEIKPNNAVHWNAVFYSAHLYCEWCGCEFSNL